MTIPAASHVATPVTLSFGITWRQFGILAHRYLDLIFGERFNWIIRLLVIPIIGIMLLLIVRENSLVGESTAEITRLLNEQHYYEVVTDAQKLLLMLTLSVILLGLFAAAYEIVKERPVYERERMINLGIVPYLASKIAVLGGFGCLQCLSLLLIVSLKVPMPTRGVIFPAPLEMYITLVLAMLTSICLGLFISAAVRKSGNGVIYIILLVLFLQIIFSGALFNLPGIAQSLSVFTQARWGLEGLGASVDMHSLNQLSQSYIEALHQSVAAPVDLSINYDSTFAHLFLTWLMQLMFAAGFAGLAGLILKWQDVR